MIDLYNADKTPLYMALWGGRKVGYGTLPQVFGTSLIVPGDSVSFEITSSSDGMYGNKPEVCRLLSRSLFFFSFTRQNKERRRALGLPRRNHWFLVVRWRRVCRRARRSDSSHLVNFGNQGLLLFFLFPFSPSFSICVLNSTLCCRSCTPVLTPPRRKLLLIASSHRISCKLVLTMI